MSAISRKVTPRYGTGKRYLANPAQFRTHKGSHAQTLNQHIN